MGDLAKIINNYHKRQYFQSSFHRWRRQLLTCGFAQLTEQSKANFLAAGLKFQKSFFSSIETKKRVEMMDCVAANENENKKINDPDLKIFSDKVKCSQ